MVTQAAAELLPDLILMDLSLPVLDGLEAARRPRQNERTREIPIVAFTAHAFKESTEHALAAGCVAVLTKPVSIAGRPRGRG
jgi:two-component system cell cycle response regulator DivK